LAIVRSLNSKREGLWLQSGDHGLWGDLLHGKESLLSAMSDEIVL
jgi:hypothetical protein